MAYMVLQLCIMCYCCNYTTNVLILLFKIGQSWTACNKHIYFHIFCECIDLLCWEPPAPSSPWGSEKGYYRVCNISFSHLRWRDLEVIF